jgi:hypothetical protein
MLDQHCAILQLEIAIMTAVPSIVTSMTISEETVIG